MLKRLEVFISQLDGLVVFLAAGHEEVFKIIRERESAWFPLNQGSKVPDTFAAYRASINNGAFVLGYAHFEAFLADLVRAVYIRNPRMLPKDQKIASKEVLDADSKEDVVRLMIEKEIRSLFYGKVEDVADHFEKKLQMPWRDGALGTLVLASRTRNCLMHNGGIVDERLAEASDQAVGEEIRLETDKVHEFGVAARRVARCMWEEAAERYPGI